MFGRTNPGDADKSARGKIDKSFAEPRLFATAGMAERESSPQGAPQPAPGKRQAENRQSAPKTGRVLTIPQGISFSGKIAACDLLIVEGSVEASLTEGKIIRVLESGEFRGAIEIEEADIAGTFEGALIVRGRLSIRAKGRVSGKIRYAELSVETGGEISGEISRMGKPTAPGEAARKTEANIEELNPPPTPEGYALGDTASYRAKRAAA